MRVLKTKAKNVNGMATNKFMGRSGRGAQNYISKFLKYSFTYLLNIFNNSCPQRMLARALSSSLKKLSSERDFSPIQKHIQ